MATESQPFLVRFFDPEIAAKDSRGRTLQDIIAYDDEELEYSHDYVQVLFPLPEGSMFNWSASTVDKATFDAFRAREDLRKSLEGGFIRMMKFYGFDVKVDDGEVKFARSSNHKSAFGNWVVRMDHNHLRISRVLRSLRVLGLDAHAAAYYDAMLKVNEDFPNRIGARSLMYWTRAAKRPLFLAPDDEDDVKTGPQFLIDFEKAKGETKSGDSAT